MFSPYLRRILIDVCLFIAFAIGMYFTYEVFIDFLISLFHFESKVNLSSIAYCVQRLMLVFMPLILLSAKLPVSKNKILKFMLFTIGICYFAANTWIISYMLHNPFSDLLYASIPRWFLSEELSEVVNAAWIRCRDFQYNDAYVFNYIVWDSYDLFGVLFSFIQGFLYIDLAKELDTHKASITRKFVVVTVVTIALPLLYNIIVQHQFFFSNDWGQRNLFLLGELLFVCISICIAATSRQFWAEIFY